MRLLALVVIIYISTVACSPQKSKAEVEQDISYPEGKFTLGDSVVEQFHLWACYCNVTDSGIRITNIGGGGFSGENLVATLDKNDTTVSFSTWTCIGAPKYFVEKYRLTLDPSNRSLNDSLTGKIFAAGTFHQKNTKMGFTIAGPFRCKLRDSTYDYRAFQDDLINIYDSLSMIKLRGIAHSNPDSIVELQLEYRHFHLIKDEIALFKNLKTLSLSGFPLVTNELISNFKHLRELRITSDTLQQLPTNLGNLKALESLTISAPITDLPESLYTLTNLKELDLGATNVSSISPELKNFKNLETLNLSYSAMVRVPTEIFMLDKLIHLELPDTLIPFKIKKWNLKSLKKFGAPYSLLAYNRENIQMLNGLEWLYPSFHYSTSEEELAKHGSRIRWLQAKLPNVDISEVIYTDD